MPRTRLNWVTQISALACLVACGSSGNGLGSGSPQVAANGGQVSASNVGGSGANKGGGASTAGVSNQGGANGNAGNGTSGNGTSGNGTSGNGTSGNGTSGNGTSGNGTSGANSQAGDSGTGSSGSTTDGGSGNGGAGSGFGGDATAGSSSIDVKITGGTGSTVDGSTGGGGSTIDANTGGGFTIDTGTGGGNTIDLGTGGGNTIDLGTGGGNTIDLGTGGGGTIDMGTGGGTSTDFPKCIKTDLNNINVYVIKDVTSPNSGADTEGNMYVGGNFYSASGYSIGKKDGAINCAEYSLVVGGTVSGALVYNGKGVAGGTISNSTDLDCPPGVVQVKTLPVDFASLATKVQNLSAAIHTQLGPTAQGTVSGAAGGLVLTGIDPAQNVFNITSAQLGTVTLKVPTTSIAIINVSGTTINWPAGTVTLPGAIGGPDSDYLFSSNVIWNFYEATSITIGGIAVEGTILAPGATFQQGGGHVAGQVIVKYMTGLGTEFHPYYFSACIKFPL
jgi:choice-of-anchor A domain-containing protein